MSSEGSNYSPKTVRRDLGKSKKQRPETKSGTCPNISKTAENGAGSPPIQFPDLEKKKKFFHTSQANKRKAQEKKGSEEIKEYLEKPQKTGELISINSGKAPEEKKKNIEYYFANHHLWSGYSRYIHRAGDMDPKERVFKMYAFDLQTEKEVSFTMKEWDEENLREARLSEKKFKSLIKRKREFLARE